MNHAMIDQNESEFAIVADHRKSTCNLILVEKSRDRSISLCGSEAANEITPDTRSVNYMTSSSAICGKSVWVGVGEFFDCRG